MIDSCTELNGVYRILRDGADVWSHNAWDHVPPPVDQQETIAAALAIQHLEPVPEKDKPIYHNWPARHWYVTIVSCRLRDLGVLILYGNVGTLSTSRMERNFFEIANGTVGKGKIGGSIDSYIYRLLIEFPELFEATRATVCPFVSYLDSNAIS